MKNPPAARISGDGFGAVDFCPVIKDGVRRNRNSSGHAGQIGSLSETFSSGKKRRHLHVKYGIPNVNRLSVFIDVFLSRLEKILRIYEFVGE